MNRSERLPYCLAQSDAGSQSSLAVRSRTFPNIGTGFGPGGKDAAEALGFRNQTKKATRRQAEAANTEVLVMAGVEPGRWWRKKLGRPLDGEGGEEEGGWGGYMRVLDGGG
jgi:hypothetical protein